MTMDRKILEKGQQKVCFRKDGLLELKTITNFYGPLTEDTRLYGAKLTGENHDPPARRENCA